MKTEEYKGFTIKGSSVYGFTAIHPSLAKAGATLQSKTLVRLKHRIDVLMDMRMM